MAKNSGEAGEGSGQSGACAIEVLGRRLARSPMPTADSEIDEERSIAFEKEEYSPFLAIRIPVPRSRDLRVGVLLSHIFKANIDLALIGKLERLARRFDLDSLLLP